MRSSPHIRKRWKATSYPLSTSSPSKCATPASSGPRRNQKINMPEDPNHPMSRPVDQEYSMP